MKKFHLSNSQDKLISSAADQFIATGSAAIRDRGQFSVALSGGSTPAPLYQYLADHKIDDLNWDKVHFFWGDERCVPPDDPDSNFNQVNQSLLIPRAIPGDNIHRIKAELLPAEAARQYQEEILDWFQHKTPSFDLILLGLGSDGHTASLFPETELVSREQMEQNQLVGANWVPKLDAWRITFMPRLINAAQNVLFLVSGQKKARILKLVLEGPALPKQYPSQLINPNQGNLLWFVDQEAASELSDVSLN